MGTVRDGVEYSRWWKHSMDQRGTEYNIVGRGSWHKMEKSCKLELSNGQPQDPKPQG